MQIASGRPWKSAALLAFALLAAVAAARAQQDEPVVIRSTTRLVELNVTILDRQRHPVSGLGADEFQVFDNGVPQKIVHFTAIVPAHPRPKTSRLTVSNRASSPEDFPGATVILLDETLLDAPAGTPLELIAPVRSARLAILTFLAHLRPGEQVGIYSLRSNGVVVIHDFTDDPAPLIAAAQNMQAGGVSRAASGADLRRSARSPLGDWARYPGVRTGKDTYRGGIEPDGAVLRGGFEQIVEHLRGVPGRKRLVWISSTLPVSSSDMEIMAGGGDANRPTLPSLKDPSPTPHHADAQNYYEELRDFARWLSSADVSVYPIDAAGLTVKGPSAEEWGAADLIATETGGEAIFNSNALDQHLQEIVDQSSGSYQIGYYPGDAAWNGKYHHVQVRLASARAAASVLCRKGYFAVDQPVSEDTDTPLQQAARSVLDSAGIGLAANIPENPMRPGPKDVVLKVDVQDIHFEHTAHRSKASLDVAFIQVGRDGHVVTGSKDRILVSLTPEMFQSSTTEGWFYRRHIWVEPGAEKVRILVRDLATGAIGSVSVPVHAVGGR